MPPPPTMPTPIECHVQDLGLALCLDFEAPTLTPTVSDGSGRGHDAMTINVHAMARAAEQAAAVTSSSQIVVPASIDLSSFDVLTQEAWVRPDVLGTGAWAINHQPQYGLAFDGTSALCQIGNSVVQVTYQTPASTWTHVACRWIGQQIELYVNGSVVGCAGAPPMVDPTPRVMYIAPELTGGIDDVRIYNGPLADQEICDHAGATNCRTSCPGD
jgi:hypothetical protein